MFKGALILATALLALAGTVSALDAGEVEALNAMRASWGASAPTNWTGSPSCAWEGIGCGPEGHVEEVQMGAYDLLGVIPPDVGKLMDLRILNISMNQLNGSIPSELGLLSGLQLL